MVLRNKMIGKYLVDYEVGAGGLGKVYKGLDPDTGQEVAIKVLHDQYQKDRRFLGIFHRELLIVSRLKHKHIVECIDVNYEPPNCYIVSEFIDGWSLYRLMKQLGRLQPLVALSVIIEVLQGIDYLHLHDTIHSDLSAPNVLISKKGRVYLTDFGLACSDEVENYKNYMIGTPGYYSPEHITDAPISPQSDVYCIGLLLYEMLTGTKAVEPSKDRQTVVNSMKSIDFKLIRCNELRMQTSLRAICRRALRYNTMLRTRNAEKMILEVYRLLKRYKVRYSRHAVLQALGEAGLVQPLPDQYKQDISRGHIEVIVKNKT